MKGYPMGFFGEPRAGRTLIIGSKLYDGVPDRRLAYKNAVGLDMLDGDGVDIVHNMEDAPLKRKFDHVECLSVLEHSRRPWLAAANIEKSMARDATLWLSVPFVWRVHGYPSDYWRFTKEAISEIFPCIKFEALSYCSGGLLVEKPVVADFGSVPFFGRTEIIGVGKKC